VKEYTMKRKNLGIALAAVLLIAATAPAAAQQPAAASDLDPAAVAALGRMGTFLRSLKAFRVTAATTQDTVLDSGQLLQVAGSVDALVQFPTKLRIDATTGERQRMYLYDGKTFTFYGKAIGYYATVPAPPTVKQLALTLADEYGLSIPLEDLFWWRSENATTSALTGATDIGPASVRGTSCEQYAFRQDGLDWQIWIQLGDYPLPRKLVLVTTDDAARPQYAATYTWDLAPSFNDAAFAFDPPASAKRIPIASVKAGK
jgi:hypothetical protein